MGTRRSVAYFALVAICALTFGVQSAVAAPPLLSKVRVSAVTSTSATLEASVNPQGISTGFHFEYGSEDCSLNPCPNVVPVPDGDAGSGSSVVVVKSPAEGLAPGAFYHFIAVVKNTSGETVKSLDRTFATLGESSIGLPDGRAYEQATPVNKDGGDAVGELGLVKAASTGGGISFGSTFGIPGGKGAQALPTYLATRGTDNWTTQGLLPSPLFGERALILGWLPDFSFSFASATQLGEPRTTAFLAQPASGSPTVIAPYTVKPGYSFAGATADASTILLEAQAQLSPKKGQPPIEAALKGASNLYVWDKASGELRLAGILNDGTLPPKGAFAGPYNWLEGISAQTLSQGGAARGYYLQDEHAVAANGDVVFTEAGTGQLYLRRNPAQPQSTMEGEKCSKAADACTLHASASHRSSPDPAGTQPAAFQAASADAKKVFFTSPEKLTDNANTGPEPPSAAISRDTIDGNPANIEADFIPEHAVGVTTDSKYVYWADPTLGAIGRAELDGKNRVPTFIAPPPGECETEAEPEEEPGVITKVTVPSTPRYLAVDSEHIYWTNTGRRNQNGEPLDGGGTIGRADLDGKEESIDPDFICGEDKTQPKKQLVSNPQGIAVNESHIYWANAAKDITKRSIARAGLGGTAVEGDFFPMTTSFVPCGVGLSSTHVYYTVNADSNNNSSVRRISLEGDEEEFLFIGKSVLRGLAVDAGHVYWAAQGEGAIGRANLELEEASREKAFITGIGGDLNGLAADAAHLYWSINGEAPGNPGNDLYRYEPKADGGEGVLTDLTPDSGDVNGAEVQGLLGASEDGTRLYFAANGDLDEGGPTKPGSCHTPTPHGSMATLEGACNLYFWEEGAGVIFVAKVRGGGGPQTTDALNWAATPAGVFGSKEFPKTSFTSPDGRTLLFRSQEKLTAYDNEGVPELYRFQVGDQAGIRCVSCQPGGETAVGGPDLGQVKFPQIAPSTGAALSSRNLSADGSKAFFETTEALVPADTNGQVECPTLGTSSQFYRACLDVYEWEAPKTGQCQESGPAYNALNGGCLYLISTGKGRFPSLFADASASGEDVFFFTRDRLVGQDQDELQDVYDARAGGGLAAQNPLFAVPCESTEACHGPTQIPPVGQSSGTATFVGPGNPVPNHKKPKVKKHKKKKHKSTGKKAGAKREAGK